MELGANALDHLRNPLLFSVAAKDWLGGNPQWSDSSREIGKLKVGHLLPRFGRMLVAEITARDIALHQRDRQKAGAAARTINMEVGALRQILKLHRRWAEIEPDIKMLRERDDVGRALSEDEMMRLHLAASRNRSRSLAVALLVFEHTGTRLGELRTMRWRQVDLIDGSLIVGKAKTKEARGAWFHSAQLPLRR